MNQCTSLSTLFASLAKKYSQATAISAPSKFNVTFEDLFQLIAATHIQLRELGINRGDRVVLAAPANSAETAILSLAIAASATCVPLDISLSDPEITAYLQQLNPQVIIAFSDYLLSLSEQLSIPRLQVISYPEQPKITFKLEGITPFTASQDDWAQSGDNAIIIMTSGSTGSPKLVPITHDSLCYSCFEASYGLKLDPQDICLNVLSLSHVHGLISNFILPLSAGGKVVFFGSFDPDYFPGWLIESQATWYSVGPTIHLAILTAIAKNTPNIKNHALRFIRSGSSPLQPQVVDKLEKQLGVPLIQGYGMSEIALFMSQDINHRYQGYLKICRDSEIAIADEFGNIVTHNTVGEIIARGRNVIAGYIDNPAANQSAFRAGWFRTGDLGYLDENGYLYVTGRLKDIINRGGNKISPQEVDNALMRLAEVEEAATFAIPDSQLGEDVVAVVVLKPEAKTTTQNIRHSLFKYLAFFKIPSQIIIIDKIPRGKTGKINRNNLVEQFIKDFQANLPGIDCPILPILNRSNINYTPPTTDNEKFLVELLSSFLEQRIGIHDNFLELGINSIQAMIFINRLQNKTGKIIPISKVFTSPTIAEICQDLHDDDILPKFLANFHPDKLMRNLSKHQDLNIGETGSL